MKAYQIKRTIDKGGNVFWKNDAYQVIKDKNDKYLISFKNNEHYIGLTHNDGQTLNGNESDFYWFKVGNEKYNDCPLHFAEQTVEQFLETIDECYQPIKIGYSTFYPSESIKTDNIFFHEAFFEYIDSIEKEQNEPFPDFLYDIWSDEINMLSYK